MDRLKSKASQFFKNGPSQDEKAANAPTDHGDEFNAGIEGRLRKKPSLFFRRGHDKALPAPPAGAVVSQEAPPLTPKHDVGGEVAAEIGDAILSPFTETEKPLSVTTANQEAPDTFGAERKDKPADLVLRKRPSFASLRKSSSRIFRTNTNNHGPPPPPMPQIPVDTPTLKPRRPIIRPLDSVRSARSSRSSSGRIVSISRPTSSTQIVQLPSTFNPSKVPFNKPSGPPPPRPARPESLDDELIILMRDGSARMILHTPSRARALTVSTSSSARSRAPTRVESDDPYTRLGLPSGHSSLSSPRSPIFDFPLAAKFPLDPSRPLPFRDSSGSIKGYGRFSAYIKAREQYSSGGYNDGVEREDRELGPIEQYRESKCGDWTLERRVSGKLGERGTLFRALSGGWHFVADI